MSCFSCRDPVLKRLNVDYGLILGAIGVPQKSIELMLLFHRWRRIDRQLEQDFGLFYAGSVRYARDRAFND